jgi:muramoyltetrapeptide carboxypeptidase
VLKIVSGIAKGKTIGGNLTLVRSTLGTPFEIDTKDKIFFLEEVREDPQTVDRLLTDLLNAGKFQAAAGIVLGECIGCEAASPIDELSLEDVIYDRLAPLGKPIIYGLPIGHTHDLATIPEGVDATIDAFNGTFSIDEAAVI